MSKKKILVIDDDAQLVDSVQALLNILPERFNLLDHRISGFTIAGIRDAFAIPFAVAGIQLDHHHVRRSLGTA